MSSDRPDAGKKNASHVNAGDEEPLLQLHPRHFALILTRQMLGCLWKMGGIKGKGSGKVDGRI